MSKKPSELTRAMMKEPGFAEGYALALRHQALGAKLKLLREERQLSQVELAASAGLDQGDISRFESGKWGKRGISFDMLEKILPVLGVQLEHKVLPEPGVQLSAESLQAVAEMSALL
jgi:transcriptional regulator with XRE-family HTH domain